MGATVGTFPRGRVDSVVLGGNHRFDLKYAVLARLWHRFDLYLCVRFCNVPVVGEIFKMCVVEFASPGQKVLRG